MSSRFNRMAVLARALTMCTVCILTAASRAATPKEPPAPEFSVPGGIYTNDLKVELKSGSPAVIRYTVDGSEPTADSPGYQSPLNIANCLVLRARAFYADGRASRTASQSYVLLAPELRRFSSNLPLIIVNVSDGEIDSDQKSFVGLHVLENKPERTMLPDRADFTGIAVMNLRGFSSLRYPKHSYSVKTVNERREPQNVSILNLPRESDWVLYGPYPDKTLMRDVLAYELSNAMGQWAPHTRYVEVFVNESRGPLSMEHYVGLYVFEEKVTRGRTRVNISNLGPEDIREPEITGGYIFKKDHGSRGERRRFAAEGAPFVGTTPDRSGFPTGPGGFPANPAGFLPPYGGATTTRTVRGTTRTPTRVTRTVNAPRAVTNHIGAAVREMVRLDDADIFPGQDAFQTTLQRNTFYLVDPEPDEITAVQRAWLKGHLNRFEAALYGPDFTDAKAGYQAFIDRDSFIDFHLLSEVTKNVDAFRFSTFYHKDRGGLIRMGPVWDWNLSFGNAAGKQGYMPEHWLWPQLNDQEYSWFRRLFEDPDFAQRYVDRWGQLRATLFATSNVLARMDSIAAHLDEAQKRNFAKWEILGRDINPNYFVGETYAEEVNWMKQWTSNRLAWIEAQFLPTPTVQHGAQTALSTTATNAQILFTLDGSDPRAPGGEVSAQAKTFQSPIALAKDAKLFARVRSGTRWSPPTVLP